MDNVLGYDCDMNEIEEFRVLRFPFSGCPIAEKANIRSFFFIY
mgnify:CR=1 FL=1